MRKLAASIVFSLIAFISAFSQGCLPEGITFSTQAEIDSFQVNYPGCSEIEGDVLIGTDEYGVTTDITSLEGLNVLTTFGGDLTIAGNTSLTSLTGLDNLITVQGSMGIGQYYSGNPSLTSLTGLENLTSIGGDLYFYCNDSLTTLTGLEGLDSIGGGLSILHNIALADLTGLDNVSSIGGDVIIGGYSLTSLAGLENLTSIPGSLSIGFGWGGGGYQPNPVLISLTGLENVTSIGGNITISMSPSLTSLSGFSNLTSIGGGFSIYGTDSLVSLTGLENVTFIGGSLNISSNDALTSLTALENLNSIEGDLNIGGYMFGYSAPGNSELIDISSLKNLDGGSINNLKIIGNNSLSNCHVQSICEYLANPNGTVHIYSNASGCNSQPEVEEACEALQCLPEGITFSTQAEIDSFQVNYPGCMEIEGNVTILGDDITNLYGLNVITVIGGDLTIGDYDTYPYLGVNDSLTSLTGLENLTSIGGWFFLMSNSALSTLTGLENLISIGGGFYVMNNYALTGFTGLDNLSSIGLHLEIEGSPLITSLNGFSSLSSIGGSLSITGNTNLTSLSGIENVTSIQGSLRIQIHLSLTSLAGLENITSIGGNLNISYNYVLASLDGLDNITSIGGDLILRGNNVLTNIDGLANISAESIEDLTISKNDSLSMCAVQNICIYLESPNGTDTIYENAPGCNSPEEVDSVCNIVSIQELILRNEFTIFPNPLESTSLIKYTIQYKSLVTLKIFDLTGQEIITLVDEVQQHGEQQVIFNSSNLPTGVYFCVLKTSPARAGQTRKIIKLK